MISKDKIYNYKNYLVTNYKNILIKFFVLLLPNIIFWILARQVAEIGGLGYPLYIVSSTLGLLFFSLLPRRKYKEYFGLFLCAYFSWCVIEITTSYILSANPKVTPYNILILFLFYLFVYYLTQRYRLSIYLTGGLIFIICCINSIVLGHRGSPVTFADFSSIRTALGISSHYNLMVAWNILFLLLLFALICILFSLEQAHREKIKFHFVKSIICLLLICFMLNAAVLKVFRFEPIHYKTAGNGYIVSLALSLYESHLQPSEDYSVAEIEKLSSQYRSKNSTDTQEDVNIIVMMNESFSDLSVLGKLNTNIEVTPYFDSLKENCIKGNCYVSVYGGNTANSEYEFLTGDSMLFYPQGQVVYSSYIKKPTASIVSNLSDQNYSSLAIHPWQKSGWNRIPVYTYLGFNDFTFIEDLDKKKIDYMRGYPSDLYDNKLLLDSYQNMTGNRKFIFNITMQNHGGYDYSGDDFDTNVYLTDSKGKYPLAEQYLTLLNKSDSALKNLIESLKKHKEKVILLFFGDHQPKLEDELTSQLYNKNLNELNLEETQRKYITPFLIWANFDIEEKTVDKISLNYLSAYLNQIAGTKLTPYHNYLLDLYEKYPVINSNGAIDKNGTYYSREQTLQLKEIKEYYNIVYNHMIDKNTVDSFFNVSH